MTIPADILMQLPSVSRHGQGAGFWEQTFTARLLWLCPPQPPPRVGPGVQTEAISHRTDPQNSFYLNTAEVEGCVLLDLWVLHLLLQNQTLAAFTQFIYLHRQGYVCSVERAGQLQWLLT